MVWVISSSTLTCKRGFRNSAVGCKNSEMLNSVSLSYAFIWAQWAFFPLIRHCVMTVYKKTVCSQRQLGQPLLISPLQTHGKECDLWSVDSTQRLRTWDQKEIAKKARTKHLIKNSSPFMISSRTWTKLKTHFSYFIFPKDDFCCLKYFVLMHIMQKCS